MTSLRQAWLVARRELRERSRSRAFQASVVFLIIGVAAMLILPALLKPASTRDVGVTGPVPATLAVTIAQQAQTAGITARVHPYASLSAGEQAVRQGQVDVLVAGARRLEWKGRPDEQLKAVVTGAIQLVTVRERAAAAGISPGAMATLLTPVPVANVQLGSVADRSPGDEMAVLVMTVVLFFGISVFGQMVLTGVLEEKASRVVEVLLARIPPRVLLAGKIAGIGLLGLAQIGVTALAALAAIAAVHSVDVPAVRGSVLAWALVWFVLGYTLYATIYGALGSLGSRVEDAQAVRPGHDRHGARLFRLVHDDRAAWQRFRPRDLILPADRPHGHAGPHRHGSGRLVGAGDRRHDHPRRHGRAGAARRARLHPGHPAQRARAQPPRSMARHGRIAGRDKRNRHSRGRIAAAVGWLDGGKENHHDRIGPGQAPGADYRPDRHRGRGRGGRRRAHS
jgi:ABC-2 type transport system permease protein